MSLLNELAHVAKEEAQAYYYTDFFQEAEINSLDEFVDNHYTNGEDHEVGSALRQLKDNLSHYGDFKEVKDMLESYNKGLTAFYNEKQAELTQNSQN